MHTLQKNIERTSKQLNIDADELQLWLDQHMGLTPYTQVQLLRMAAKYQLDPLSDEIGLMDTIEGHQVFITIDGWIKIINEHEHYAGMSLRESTTVSHEVPEWMECTIYRNDRILPIVIKEYLEEVLTDHPSWQKMPRRMLRHRVIQQCARVAFGISLSDPVEHKKSSAHNLSEKIHCSTKFRGESQSRSAVLKERLSQKSSGESHVELESKNSYSSKPR
ncbi:recombinase RecT [Polynucleobacter sp. MWH-CaK5]|jgi:hypothetical protein|uniref:recombinase RecT n=1 Tax=Polynucleobacter sp. MWH-CaK5 TaxID=2689107 RepID=UPI001BFE03BC|nr:recombinase RecT [Polynucleobacter sp. MWH-CaK5]QWD88183.1 recombinase RecT [Polynucleobacter sp. MWH-CaK5]